jgi:sulfite exporter TauE/SafE
MKTNLIKEVFKLINLSILDKNGKVSSGRLSSYFILGAILTSTAVFIGIDITNAIIAMLQKGFYEIPTNHIVLYGMMLAHHLALLGINKNSETKIEQAIQDKMKSFNQLNARDMPTTPIEDAPTEDSGDKEIIG